MILMGLFSFKNNEPLKPKKGIASYYSNKFKGRKTSSGERYHPDSLTAAHKTLPFGTMVKVRHLKNNKEVIVKINDRLPAKSRRLIDLSYSAAKEIEIIKSGLANVELEIIP